jgi:hypothetical protein
MRESFLLRIAADPPARVWSGNGDLVIPADTIEASAATYLGGGELLSAPDFQQLIGGTAERLDITVSGVTAETLRLAREDADSIKGAAVHLGTIRFDDDWQQGAVVWEDGFRVDTLSVNSQSGDESRSRTITLSIGTDDTGRSRAPIAFFTDADQRRRSPTDAFCDQVAGISSGTSRRFGPV